MRPALAIAAVAIAALVALVAVVDACRSKQDDERQVIYSEQVSYMHKRN
jgi:hypothetical protein